MLLKQLLREFRDHIRLLKFKEEWRSYNPQNATKAGNCFPKRVVTIGKHTYGTLNVHYFEQREEHLYIGDFCSVADNTHFMLGGDHEYKTLMTFPFKNRVTKNQIHESLTKGPIVIEDDVWIGFGCTILSGTHIGQGAVIGAGSVVSGKIPSYAIYIGNRVVKFRFEEEVIGRLAEWDLKNIQWEKLSNNYELLYTRVTKDNVCELLRKAKEKLEG